MGCNNHDHSIHSIMSRTGSFPIRVASRLLEEYAHSKALVLDPFCGKGTTLLAARLLGLPVVGMDIAPEAVLCSLAKMQDIEMDAVKAYIKKIRLGKPSLDRVPDDVRCFFSDHTLSQLLSIRNAFSCDIDDPGSENHAEAIFSMALLLGILHGHASYSLSVPSAHAYSMAPNYVRKYSEKNGLTPPDQDVKECLCKKLTRCLKDQLPPPVPYEVVQGNATTCATDLANLTGKIDVILTSPPYLNAQTYAKDNWLRLWLLGYDYKSLRSHYIQTGSIEKYKTYMTNVFRQLSHLLKTSGVVICIAGTVTKTSRSKGKPIKHAFNTGDFLAKLVTNNDFGLKLFKYDEHLVPSSLRYYHSLTKTNGHKPKDLVETVFIAKKV